MPRDHLRHWLKQYNEKHKEEISIVHILNFTEFLSIEKEIQITDDQKSNGQGNIS